MGWQTRRPCGAVRHYIVGQERFIVCYAADIRVDGLAIPIPGGHTYLAYMAA
jgi:hypothetical protein